MTDVRIAAWSQYVLTMAVVHRHCESSNIVANYAGYCGRLELLPAPSARMPPWMRRAWAEPVVASMDASSVACGNALNSVQASDMKRLQGCIDKINVCMA